VLFLFIISMLFCSPSLEGKLLNQQSDVIHWKAVSEASFRYKETYGTFPVRTAYQFNAIKNQFDVFSITTGAGSPGLMAAGCHN
jgi:hypothetical protein